MFWFVQVQATRIVTRAYAERRDPDVARVGQSEQFASFCAVGIVNDRQHGIDEHGISACPGMPIAVTRIVVTSEGTNRNEDESRERHHGHSQHAPTWAVTGVPESQTNQCRRSMPGQRLSRS